MYLQCWFKHQKEKHNICETFHPHLLALSSLPSTFLLIHALRPHYVQDMRAIITKWCDLLRPLQNLSFLHTRWTLCSSVSCEHFKDPRCCACWKWILSPAQLSMPGHVLGRDEYLYKQRLGEVNRRSGRRRLRGEGQDCWVQNNACCTACLCCLPAQAWLLHVPEDLASTN